MQKHMCGFCCAALTLCALPWLGVAILLIVNVFLGHWIALAWLTGITLAYGGFLFFIAYIEARSHWKRGERYE